MNNVSEREATSIRREFEGASGLRDRRLEARLVDLAEQWRAAPDQSFPDIAPREADLTALYRFLNNPSVTPAVIMEPHQHETVRRCEEAGCVALIHDTTEFEFAGAVRRSGLGRLRTLDDQGFHLHLALAVVNDGSRRPLGVLGAQTWVREALGSSRLGDGRKKSGSAYANDANKESARWGHLIRETEERLGRQSAIHVFDREGDAYPLLHELLAADVRFVTRMARDRVVLDEDGERIGRVSEALLDVVDVADYEVPLSRRAPKSTPRMTDAPREARTARLAVGATRMHLAPPHYIGGTPESLEVNIVYVHEIGPPSDLEPVCWVLITSEPVERPEQIRAVVEAYKLRWLIEEFFKALKTGCAVEKRQLESYESLTAALAIALPIAWHLLLLRSLARTDPKESAELVLSPTQIEVLRAVVPASRLPPQPTLAQALRGVAYLGGHFIKRDPGWLVLGRGLRKLLDLETGWRLATAARSDRT